VGTVKSSPRWLRFALGVGTVVALIGAGFIVARMNPKPKPPEQPVVESGPGGMNLTTTRDAVVVFTRAFWRKPTAADRVLHAERRELATADKDVRAWQWFLAVEPGPDLQKWLEGNPFSLVKAQSLPVPPAGARPAPDWFPRDARDYDLWVAPDGRFALLIAHGRNLIFATDSGAGFSPSINPAP